MFKKISGTLVAILFWLMLFEFLGYLLFSYTAKPFDEIKRLLRADKNLGWQQKPGKNIKFLGTNIHIDERGYRNSQRALSSDAKRVLVLGPSSAFGWGVEEDETYAKVLAHLLQQYWGSPVDVYNASAIGYSSEQGRKIYQNTFQKQNFDLVLVAYGVNDVDRHRFFFDDDRDDEEFFRESLPPTKTKIINIMSSSYLFSSLVMLRRDWAHTMGCPVVRGFNKVRVSRERAIENIIFIAESESAKGTRVVLLDTPYLLETKNLGSNIALYEKAALETEQGNCKQARVYLSEARSAERGRISHDLGNWNKDLQKAAKNVNLEFVALHGLLDESQFVDPVHPNKSGHRFIAELLFKSIKGRDVQ